MCCVCESFELRWENILSRTAEYIRGLLSMWLHGVVKKISVNVFLSRCECYETVDIVNN